MQNNRESQSCYDSIYDRVIKYQVRAECREPLHIGSGEKEQGLSIFISGTEKERQQQEWDSVCGQPVMATVY